MVSALPFAMKPVVLGVLRRPKDSRRRCPAVVTPESRARDGSARCNHRSHVTDRGERRYARGGHYLPARPCPICVFVPTTVAWIV